MKDDNLLHIDFSAERCRYCGKPAKFACDMPVSSNRWAGHPPLSEMDRGNMSLTWKTSCDNPMCETCAISLGKDVHICPECAMRVKVKEARKG